VRLSRLNQGACDSIYKKAQAHFKSQPQNDWIAQCEDVRARLGEWQTFNDRVDNCLLSPGGDRLRQRKRPIREWPAKT
jgi:hypothetical protein